jgi:hypothetical protein
MRIPDADPEDQNHADPCGCGSATLQETVLQIFSPSLFLCQSTYLQAPNLYCQILLFKRVGSLPRRRDIQIQLSSGNCNKIYVKVVNVLGRSRVNLLMEKNVMPSMNTMTNVI